MRVTFALIISGLFAIPAFATVPEHVQFANKAFHDVLLKCPERIWSGLDFSSSQFVFIAGDEAWLVGPQVKDAQAIPLPAELYTDGWSISELNGQKTVFVNIDAYSDSLDQPLRVASHEYFHDQVQAGWKMPAADRRGDFFPLLPEPRYARASLLQALKANDLAGAAAWLDLWKNQWPEENAINTDLREGTARYAEQMVAILSDLGCDAKPEAVARAGQGWIDGLEVDGQMDLDLEGYLLGAVSGLMLDARRADWKSRVAAGVSPLELLLEKQTRGEIRDDKKLSNTIRENVTDRNDYLDIFLGTMEMDLGDEEYVRVGVPYSLLPETLSLSTFVPLAAPESTYSLFQAGQTIGSQDAEFVRLEHAVVGITLPSAPCEGTSFYFLVPSEEIRLDRGVASVSQLEDISIRLGVDARTKDGYRYLCPRG